MSRGFRFEGVLQYLCVRAGFGVQLVGCVVRLGAYLLHMYVDQRAY
jgi:hypothetical protein